MEYETHLTLRPADVDRISSAAAALGLKHSHIVLDRGTTPSQPMLSARAGGPLAGRQDAALAWAEALRADGFTVVRIKIEAAPTNPEVPRTDAAAANAPAWRYFEHHVKVLLPAEWETALRSVAAPHGARLSRNARRVRADGQQERFVTQRCHRVGRATARSRLDLLLAAVRVSGHASVVEVEEEYVVQDDNLDLDGGWLAP